MPLELFVLVGSFIEEAISPIPSFVVMLPAGALAHLQGQSWWYLWILAVFAALGRVPASLLLYFVADKSEDWLFGKGRRLFGVSHKQLESIGKRFSGSPRDFTVLFLLNAIPVIPTSLLSLTCGFIKLRLKLFIVATFFGTGVNAFIYMLVGYTGIQAAGWLGRLDAASTWTAAGLAIILVAAGLYYYWRHWRAPEAGEKKRGR
ncbi:MAG TPA: VTT domain-containing protein [Candidatus Pristimantibacillus sp.]|nr:VTT domain-containing protein [Candidatus Pristimantibacillus sp.]